MVQSEVSDGEPTFEAPAARLRGVTTIDGLLENVTFTVPAGALTVVFGPAGAGKTALADVLRLAKQPERGAMDVFGENIARLSLDRRAKLKRQIGILAQSPVLLDHLSAMENVTAPLRLAGRKPEEHASDVTELFTYLGLKLRDDRPVAYLSGSERRRVATARAVVTRPALLVADEPCSGLAPDAAGRILKLLLQVRRSGSAVVVLTQDEDLAASLPGPMWRMADGKMTAPDPAEAPA